MIAEPHAAGAASCTPGRAPSAMMPHSALLTPSLTPSATPYPQLTLPAVAGAACTSTWAKHSAVLPPDDPKQSHSAVRPRLTCPSALTQPLALSSFSALTQDGQQGRAGGCGVHAHVAVGNGEETGLRRAGLGRGMQAGRAGPAYKQRAADFALPGARMPVRVARRGGTGGGTHRWPASRPHLHSARTHRPAWFSSKQATPH